MKKLNILLVPVVALLGGCAVLEFDLNATKAASVPHHHYKHLDCADIVLEMSRLGEQVANVRAELGKSKSKAVKNSAIIGGSILGAVGLTAWQAGLGIAESLGLAVAGGGVAALIGGGAGAYGSLKQDQEQAAAKYAQLKGQFKAVETTAVTKSCNMAEFPPSPFQEDAPQ